MGSKYIFLIIFLAGVMVTTGFDGTSSAQSSGTTNAQKAAFRDPHLVHFEIGQDIPPIGFSIPEIKNWPDFVKGVQRNLKDLPFSHEMKFLIQSLIPTLISLDEKKVIVSEMNRFLVKPELYSQMTSKTTFSETTKELKETYLKSKTQEDLKWLNRSIINDLIPETPKVEVSEGKKFNKLRNINCLTCHEAWDARQQRREGDVAATRADLKDLESLTEMISSQLIRPRPTPPPKPDKIRVDDEFLKNYENLKKNIIRPNLHGNPVLIEAVHPEDPYTYKPLLKRLVCLDCHAPGRDIDKIKHADGKTHRIKFLYGPVEETLDEKHAQ